MHRSSSFIKWVERAERDYWLNTPALLTTKNPATGAIIELLLRVATYQVERVTHGPYEIVPLHRHPLVDSYEFPLWGSGEIWLGKHVYTLNDEFTPWRGLFISHRTWHGGRGFERGGAFLSAQIWHKPITGSVITSWESHAQTV